MNKHTPTTPSGPSGPQLIEIARQLTSTFPARQEIILHQASVLRTRYNALMERGFTDVQALHLCTQDWSQAL